MKQLILIDGNSLLFRAYFAMRPMVTSEGIHTQGIYAFINMLNKIINEYSPDYIAVAFDKKGKTFRHEKYDAYKAGRQKTPIELLTEIPLLHEVLRAMNVAILELDRYEADDIIGTVASKAQNNGMKTLIISGDKDELQLVDKNTNVLINKRGMSEFEIYDIDKMQERYSLTPKQFIDLKGLMGDKSDNIPGIAGIGEKKGIDLLQEYGSLENVIENADKIKGKMGENIRDSIDIARMSKWLATIDTDAPLDIDFEKLRYEMPIKEELLKIYTKLEFNSFIKNMQLSSTISTVESSSENTIMPNADDVRTVDFDEFLSLQNEDDNYHEVYIDIISDANHLKKPFIKEILLYSHDDHLFSRYRINYTDEEKFENEIINKILSSNLSLCGYDIKRVLYCLIMNTHGNINGMKIKPAYDISIAEYLLDPNRKTYDISKMLLRYCNYAVSENDRIICEPYLSMDKEYTDNDLIKRFIYISSTQKVQKKHIKDNELTNLFENVEMPLTLTLAEMESVGIKCNKHILDEIGREIDSVISKLEDEIYHDAGLNFNINSPKQLAGILFEHMNIPYPKQKGKTSYSTSADILEKIRDKHVIIDKILEYRKLSKLKSTYVDGLYSLIGFDDRIRPHFKQTVAATGRLSCTEPNLQNIPIRDEFGRMIRNAFVAENGNVFIGSDYSQIELRIMAALSEDKILIDAFNMDKDIHKITASRIFNIPEKDVTSTDRSKAKAVNFGVIYGISGFGLSENLHISRFDAQNYIDSYFNKHEEVKNYLDNLVKESSETHISKTYFGRIRQIPEFASRKYMERELAKRLAMNTPIQGTAADLIKIAMNLVAEKLRSDEYKSRMILQIHDELIIEGPEYESEKVKKLLEDCMENAVNFSVKLKCDIHSATNWYNLK